MYLAETILQNLISLANILKWTIILSKKRSELKITVWFTVLAPVMFVSNENYIYCIRYTLFAIKWFSGFLMFADCPDFADILQAEENRANTTC